MNGKVIFNYRITDIGESIHQYYVQKFQKEKDECIQAATEEAWTKVNSHYTVSQHGTCSKHVVGCLILSNWQVSVRMYCIYWDVKNVQADLEIEKMVLQTIKFARKEREVLKKRAEKACAYIQVGWDSKLQSARYANENN